MNKTLLKAGVAFLIAYAYVALLAVGAYYLPSPISYICGGFAVYWGYRYTKTSVSLFRQFKKE